MLIHKDVLSIIDVYIHRYRVMKSWDEWCDGGNVYFDDGGVRECWVFQCKSERLCNYRNLQKFRDTRSTWIIDVLF